MTKGLEIRWLIVKKRYSGFTHRKIAKHLCIAPSTSIRTWKLFKVTGSVDGAKRKRRVDAILSDEGMSALEDIIQRDPSLFLDEIADELERGLHVTRRPSVPTLCMTLHVSFPDRSNRLMFSLAPVRCVLIVFL